MGKAAALRLEAPRADGDIADLEGELYQRDFLPLLDDRAVLRHAQRDLAASLGRIGLSEPLVSELTASLGRLDFDRFHHRHGEELRRVYLEGFFGRVALDFHDRFVVPEVPRCARLVDLGCGAGLLARRIAESGRAGHVTGIDLAECPSWGALAGPRLAFEVVGPSDFVPFLRRARPDVVIVTWALHHLTWDEQERYLRSLRGALRPGARVVALEDSMSEVLSPEAGVELHDRFAQLHPPQRMAVLAAYDWVTNIFLERRAMPLPAAYRTLEGWCALGARLGFRVVRQRYLGFPAERDVNSPQALFVLAR